MKRLLYILTVLVTASCVYPFNPDIADATDHSLVVSGDIEIGSVSTFQLGYTFPLTSTNSEMRADYPTGAKVWVEDSNGKKYNSTLSGKTRYLVDLTTASPELQYKLHVGVDDAVYETPLMDVQTAPEITGFKYSADDTSVGLLLSLDGGDGSKWFRWDYVETWEYHADFVPTLMFVSGLDEADNQNPSKIYRARTEEEDYYYCWNSSNNVECGLATSDGQSANKIVDNCFTTISRSSKKLSEVYRIDITARGITRDCYGYWHNLAAISNTTGSLFSPTPSEVRGNIYNTENSSEMVYGYIEATRTSSARFYIKHNEAHLYRNPENPENLKFYPEPDEDGKIDFEYYYTSGYAPVTTPGEDVAPTRTNVSWAPKRCTDCRVEGGTKSKPADWPDTHK